MILTILKRKTIYAIVLNIVTKTANAVMDAFSKFHSLFEEQFRQVFKTITGDSASEFTDSSTIK